MRRDEPFDLVDWVTDTQNDLLDNFLQDNEETPSVDQNEVESTHSPPVSPTVLQPINPNVMKTSTKIDGIKTENHEKLIHQPSTNFAAYQEHGSVKDKQPVFRINEAGTSAKRSRPSVSRERPSDMTPKTKKIKLAVESAELTNLNDGDSPDEPVPERDEITAATTSRLKHGKLINQPSTSSTAYQERRSVKRKKPEFPIRAGPSAKRPRPSVSRKRPSDGRDPFAPDFNVDSSYSSYLKTDRTPKIDIVKLAMESAEITNLNAGKPVNEPNGITTARTSRLNATVSYVHVRTKDGRVLKCQRY